MLCNVDGYRNVGTTGAEKARALHPYDPNEKFLFQISTRIRINSPSREG